MPGLDLLGPCHSKLPVLFTDHNAQKPHRPSPEAVSSLAHLRLRWAQGPIGLAATCLSQGLVILALIRVSGSQPSAEQ